MILREVRELFEVNPKGGRWHVRVSVTTLVRSNEIFTGLLILLVTTHQRGNLIWTHQRPPCYWLLQVKDYSKILQILIQNQNSQN